MKAVIRGDVFPWIPAFAGMTLWGFLYQIQIKGFSPAIIYIDHDKRTVDREMVPLAGNLDKKRVVSIEWDAKKLNENYLGFKIERKVDKGNFENQTSEPYILISTNAERKDKLASYRDENVEQGKTYTYRVTAYDYFGFEGAMSNEVEIYIPKLVNAQVYIDTITAKGFNRTISFFTEAENPNLPVQIKEFEVLRSDSLKEGYTLLKKMPFDPQSSNYSLDAEVDKLTGDRHYYKVLALSVDGDSVLSTPYYFFTLDQEPPQPVKDLNAKVDSNGVVSLSWVQDTDADLKGFRVFRANGKREEYVELTRRLSLSRFYSDTLKLNTLTNKAYYFVVAVDQNFNMSANSDSVLLIKPDTIPPSQPVLLKVLKEDLAIRINWTNSYSDDVLWHALVRSEGGKIDTLKRWQGREVSSYLDSNIQFGRNYAYRVVVSDEAGNVSESKTSVFALEPGYRPALKNVSAVADRNKKLIELQWDEPEEAVFQYFIYRKKNEGKFQLIETLEAVAGLKAYSDSKLQISNSYEYLVQYQTRDGFRSLKHEGVGVDY